MNDEKINEIIEEIIEDISDRRGLKNEWNGIDKDIQDEIKEVWFNIIKEKIYGRK